MAKEIKILLAGDSFAAKWNGEYPGWADLLAKEYSIKNVAQAGVGEYKILKQIENNNTKKFDLVIVSHTSPFRVHTPIHPIKRKGLHENCDLIFNDLENNQDKSNESLVTALNWFKHHYDEQYQEDIYKLMRNEIDRNVQTQYLAVDHTSASSHFGNEADHLDFSEYWPNNRGDVNHYTKEGNEFIFKSIVDKINEMSV